MSAQTALIYKTLCTWRNQGRLIRRDSRFKIAFVSLVFGGFFLGIRQMFLHSFRFMDSIGGLSSLIINSLFALFFLGLGAMMVFSGVVTAYATLYDSDEVPFLLAAPVPARQLVLARVAEAVALSSWAFFFIIIPFVSAYQQHERLSPLFLLAAVAFAVPFLILGAGAGALAVIALVRWAPRGRRLVMPAVTGIAILALALAALFFRDYRAAPSEEAFILARLAPGLRLASRPFLPSWWMAEGIMSLSRGMWTRGLLFWILLASHAALMLTVIEAVGGAVFFESWQRAAGSSAARRRPILFAALEQAAGRLFPPDIRAMLFKDIRTFLRDPAQWGQSLIFFGLLALYFLNLRQFRYHLLPDVWRSLISFLNVFSVSSVLCSLAARFVYPQLSMEGHGFWILNLAPTSPRRILLAKFGLSATAMLLISLFLMTVSTAMLSAAPLVRAVTLAVGVAVPLAVSALSTGLGALFLDLRERNPAAIVSGFGGTLNLVSGLAFMLLAILPFAALFHLSLLGRIPAHAFHRGLLYAVLWLAVLTAVAVFVPLRLGMRSLENRDY